MENTKNMKELSHLITRLGLRKEKWEILFFFFPLTKFNFRAGKVAQQGSVCASCQASLSEFDAWKPHDRKEPLAAGLPLTSTHTLRHE